jgi:ferritin-like metal-binding protein YciE
MADDKLQQKLADYVEDAHAMEQNDLKMIDSIISTTDDPQMKEMLQNHKRETEEHERRLRERLDALGRGTSPRKQAQRWALRYLRVWVTWQGATRQARTRETATPQSI